MASNQTTWTQYNDFSSPIAADVERIPRVERTLTRRNRTLFKPKEASRKNLRMFRRLKKHQHDLNKVRADIDLDKKVQEEDKFWLITTLGQQLDLPTSMIAHSRNWFMSLDLQKMGHKMELVAFSVLLHVMKYYEKKADSPWNRAYHPSRDDDKNDERARQLVEELPHEFNITERNIRKLFGKLGQSPDTRDHSTVSWSEFESEEPPFINRSGNK